MRKPYIMKVEEIQTLIAGFVSNGQEDTYNKIKAKALFAMDKIEDIDDMFLDMSESFLKLARDDTDIESEDNPSLSSIYYVISYMLRKVAHEIYSKYIKKGEQRDNSRFIRLISYNKDAPLVE